MPERQPYVKITDVTKYTLTDAEVRRAIVYWMDNEKNIFLAGAENLTVGIDDSGFATVTAEWGGETMTVEEYNKRRGDVEEKS